MAVITDIDSIMGLFESDSVRKYLASLRVNNSETMQRIFALEAPSFIRFDIGDGVYAIEQTFYTKDRGECFFESHKKYVDVQIALSGNEYIELTNIRNLKTDKPYDAEKDLVTYELADNAHRLHMKSGECALFFHEDAHLCVEKVSEPERVFKTVLKVPAEMFRG